MSVRIGRGRGRGRGQPVANAEVIEEMRELRDCMEAVELGRQRDPVERDVSEPEGDEQEEEAKLM